MNCKYCKAELESNSSVCPKCGKDNLKDDLKVLKIVALSLVCLVMVLLLGGMINYGVTGSFIPDWLIPDEEAKLDKYMDQVVATMGDHKLTNRQFQLYYWMKAQSEEGEFDLTKDLADQIQDEETGKTWEAYFTEEAIEIWQQVMLLSDAATEAGFTMPEDYQEYLDSMEEELEYYANMYATYYGMDVETADDMVQLQFGPGCDFATYYDYTYHYYLGGLYWQQVIDGLEVTDQQIEDYFTEHEQELKEEYEVSITKDFGNLVDLRNILINVGTKEVEGEDGETQKVEDWEACLVAAQEILDAWLAGEKTAESFGALAQEKSEDDNSASLGGLYEGMYAPTFTEVDVRHILIFPQGATSSTITSGEFSEEAWDWAKKEAQTILDTWLAGDMTEEAFAELAKEHSQDGSATSGGLIEDVYLGQMVANFEDWCFDLSRQHGDYGIVESEYGYHIMFFVRADREVDDWFSDPARQIGDYAIVKTDGGYQILYIQDAEPAWYRVCRYGVQGEMGDDMLEEMQEENPVTTKLDKIVICDLELE